MEQPWLETAVLEEEAEDWAAENEEEDLWTETEAEDEDEVVLSEEEPEFDYEAEEEWPNPFATTTGEDWGETEDLEEWASPFATQEQWEAGLGEEWETKAAPAPAIAASACFIDKQASGPRWQHRPKTPITPGTSHIDRFPRNEIQELRLQDFRVDDFRLMAQHKAALDSLAKEITTKIRNRTYVGMVRIRVTGSTSSTASVTHNVRLSEHRAYNVIQTLQCLIGEDLAKEVDYGWSAVGEQVAARATGQQVETPQFRGVMVRVMSPIACPLCKAPGKCRCPQRPTVPPRLPPGRTTTTLCLSVPRVDPRRAGGIPPDVLPLGALIPGLPLPVAVVTKARAVMKVDSQIQRASATYELQGWGLEIALPSSGRVTVDLRAKLQATLDLIARTSSTLAGRLNLGPLGLVLRIDASAFARLLVKLAGELRVHLSLAFAPRPLPELSGCTRVIAAPIGGAYSPQLLTGPATLMIPGRGLGPAQLRLGTSKVRLNPNPVALPADKSTVNTVLLIGGDLRLAGSGFSREDEAYLLETEAFEDWETEVPSEMEAQLVRGV